MNEQRGSALALAGLGYPVLPCHCIRGDRCSCGKPVEGPEGVRCESPGKHPRTPHGFKDATADLALIRDWWDRWPDAGVGVCTGELGEGRYLVALDVDGDSGSDSLAELEREHEELPPTVSATTRRGHHHYFLSPHPVGCSEGRLAPGLDIRGVGGYVVAPPGEGREWDVPPGKEEPAELPEWLRALLKALERPIENGSRPGGASREPIPYGRRDSTLTSLAGSMRRRGMTAEEITAALGAVNRRCRPPLPESDVRRIAESVGRYAPAEGGGRAGSAITARAFSTIRPARVEWLDGWKGRVPLGMLTLLSGDPGLGKSLLTTAMAARLSRRGAAALLLSAEDSPEVTIRPRLEAAGADLTRVSVVEAQRDGLPAGLALPDDAARLSELVGEHEARLVVVDPLMAHLPAAVNSWSDQSVRRALVPLHRLADEHGCAVVVVSHLNKASGTDPLHRTGGSIGISAAVRSMLLLGRDRDDPDGERGSRRVLAHAKCNVGPLAPSLLYGVSSAGGGAATINYLGESDSSASALLADGGDGERTATEEATDFLADELADGEWHESKGVKAKAKAAGHSVKAVRSARERLGIEDRRQGFPAVSKWRLPDVPSLSDHEGTTEQGTTGQSQPRSGDAADSPTSHALCQIEGPAEHERPARRPPAERLATPEEEEADAARGRAKFAAEPEPDDGLTDLGTEEPLPDPVAGKARARGCRCDRPRPERGLDCVTCGKCGRALSEGS